MCLAFHPVNGRSQLNLKLRFHSQRTVNAEDMAVNVFILHNVLRKCGKLIRDTKTRWEGDIRSQFSLRGAKVSGTRGVY
jgi:hypothetical protein